jgi:uncharacterized protein
MSFSLRRPLPAFLALLLALLPPAALPAAGLTFKVQDGAGLFSKDAVEKANKKIAEIKRRFDKDLLVETFKHPPDDLKKEYKEEGKKKFFQDWSRSRYKSEGVRGVYVLICNDPRSLYVRAGDATTRKGFPEKDQEALNKLLLENLRKKKPDEALLSAVDYVETTLEKNGAKASGPSPTASRPSSGAAGAGETTTNSRSWFGGSSIMGLVCIGIVALLAIWLVFGVIRALTGGGRPTGGPGYGGGGGPGYGPGGGPGYAPGYGGGGGGGGGGFFSSLMGGMFGAAAGSYLYNQFAGGHSSTPTNYGPSSYAGDSGNPTNPAPDDSNSSGGGAGGDWDSGSGGDDAGGGAGGDGGGGGGDW